MMKDTFALQFQAMAINGDVSASEWLMMWQLSRVEAYRRHRVMFVSFSLDLRTTFCDTADKLRFLQN
jgi:hypothetical protein